LNGLYVFVHCSSELPRERPHFHSHAVDGDGLAHGAPGPLSELLDIEDGHALGGNDGHLHRPIPRLVFDLYDVFEFAISLGAGEEFVARFNRLGSVSTCHTAGRE
jgi:hypothetical protein